MAGLVVVELLVVAQILVVLEGHQILVVLRTQAGPVVLHNLADLPEVLHILLDLPTINNICRYGKYFHPLKIIVTIFCKC